MHRILLPVILLLLLAGAGCGSGESDFTSDNLIEKIFNDGEGGRLELLSGAYVDFPQGTFTERQLVSISDILGGSDSVQESFPTPTRLLSDRVAGIILNTPVDALFHRDLTINFALNENTAPGTKMVVFIHDSELGSRKETYDNDYVTWYRFGAFTATVDSSGNFASFVLPTTDNRGFFGSLALFHGMTETAMGAATTTEVNGRVVDHNGNGVSTDVTLSFLIGENRVPMPLLNGSFPSGGTVRNMVTSDSSGNFTMQVPDIYISQVFNVSFAEFDAGHSFQDHFTVNAPYPIREAEVNNFVIRYDQNNIVSEPVGTT